ncbi:uncharacterized protein LOC144098828 isoform X1 [Amblyomma americanum]
MDGRWRSGSWFVWLALAATAGGAGRADGLARFAHRRSDAMDIALRQINLSLLYTLACDTSVSTEVQVKRFQCLLNNIDPADKTVVLGCQYNVGGTMDAATFLTSLCENKLPCTKLRACMASERSKNNMRPQMPPTMPEAENPIQAGVSGPEQGGVAVPSESTAAPPTSAPTEETPEEPSTASVVPVPPSTAPAPPPEGGDPPPVKPGGDEGSREDEPSLPSTADPTPGTVATEAPPPPPPVDAQPPPDDPLPLPGEVPGASDEMSFYPCLCARKAKYRGLLWKPRMNSRRTRAITWKDYNFIFPLNVVRECLVASY